MEKVAKPKSLSTSGIPGLISSLQTEWDSMVLETFELRKHLENVRKQLAHGLYQHDAACRVISRLIQERDEARQALAMTQEKLSDYKDKFGVNDLKNQKFESLQKPTQEENDTYEQDNCGIYPELQEKMSSLATALFTGRKDRKKPDDYYKPSDFNLLTEKGSYPLHSSTAPGILSLDIHKSQCNYICTGGRDGVAVVFDSSSNKVVTTLNNSLNNNQISDVQFTQNGVLLTREPGTVEFWTIDLLARSSELRTTIQGHPGVVAQIHPLNPYFVFGATNSAWGLCNMETGSKLCTVDLDDGDDLTSVAIHPDGLMLATGSSSGRIKIWDLRSQNVAATLDGHKAAVSSLVFSEKGIQLASSSLKENIVQLWSLKKLEKPPKNMVHKQGGVVRDITFDPYGAYAITACDNSVCFFESSKPEKCLFELEAHKDSINKVKFAMDGSYLATVSEDRFMKIFAQ